ncbi:MAG: glycosyltransferase [Geminocystis sp.]|nr:glycosyltransferase [Geminocystis sp.]MCS7146559.1 glycosyltransferase [Geminocystis sp.]MDW8117322.1 glycosyltransferase family 2 protein [Geminocystis sp.]MDW8462872.1 glycosyltransferase family 2 protein [Geminocystis sp.]
MSEKNKLVFSLFRDKPKGEINIPALGIENSKIPAKPGEQFDTHLFLPEGEGRKGEGGLRTKGFFKFSYKLVDGAWHICNFDGHPVMPAPTNIQGQIEEYVESIDQGIDSSRQKITELPLITVITVVLNKEKFLEETIQSVIAQTYPNVEYLIIDGGSTDGTLDIIRRYEEYIDYWVSEKDGGIYDAMNKGINVASGEWINFMNGGDSFFQEKVLEKVFTNHWKDVDVIYGNHQVVYPGRRRIVKAGEIKHIWKGSQFCHQSAFVRKKAYKVYGFNTSRDIAADFEFFYTLYKKNMNFKYIDLVIANYPAGGLSDVRRIKTLLEWWSVVGKNGNTNLYYTVRIITELLKLWLKTTMRKMKSLFRV